MGQSGPEESTRPEAADARNAEYEKGLKDKIERLSNQLLLITEQRNKAWDLAEHRERNVEYEKRLEDKVERLEELCDMVVETAKNRLARIHDLQALITQTFAIFRGHNGCSCWTNTDEELRDMLAEAAAGDDE